MNKFALSSIALSCLLLSGCETTAINPASSSVYANQPHESVLAGSVLNRGLVSQVLNTPEADLWQQSFGHHSEGMLAEVADGIAYLAMQPSLSDEQYQQLEKLSFYLRIFSSFGPDKDWPEGVSERLNSSLLLLSNRSDFFSLNTKQVRLHENYAVALYRLYYMEQLQDKIGQHVDNLSKLIELYGNGELGEELAYDYALWEVVRSAGILAHEARSRNKAPFIEGLSQGDKLQQALLSFVTSKNASRDATNKSSWPRDNALWGLSKWYALTHKQFLNAYYEADEEIQKQLDDDKITWPIEDKMTALDNQVWQSLSALSDADRKAAFSVPYVVNTFRGKTECDEDGLKGRCTIPTIEEALPQRKDCSESIFILAQSMTDEQLNKSCERLTTQTDTFHQKLATKMEPVANDFNHKLRVVIFDDQSQYNIYGQLIFDIGTDNGGMYIEGTPQNPDNQATFYAYEQFWARPDFKVWNLNHEYVHYLDGRYVKYDTFNHFPSHLVWWSEGLAEYISMGDDNARAAKLLHDVEQDKWLSLKEVFDTAYQDGGDRVYRWSYMATRFLNEQAPDVYRKMAHYLKTDYFDGYKGQLDETSEKLQDKFALWLDEFDQAHQAKEEAKDPTKPRQFYRYSYRRYLKPQHLVEDPRHMHWQYWHANAYKERHANAYKERHANAYKERHVNALKERHVNALKEKNGGNDVSAAK